MITICIPTRNRFKCLKRVLPTYVTQKHVSEILLVDDNSDPPIDYAELGAEGGPPVRVHRLPHRHGQPAARNIAVSLATTEWLFFSDDDVFLEPDYIERLVEVQQRTGADMLAGRRIMLADGEDREAAMARAESIRDPIYDPRRFDANFQRPVPEDMEVLHLQTTALIRRSVAAEIKWDSDYKPPSYREETDFYIRAAKAGYRSVLCKDALCFHLSPSDTATGGQRARTWWQYELGVVRCNSQFLSRHFDFLREKGAIEGPRWLAELRFRDWRLRGGFLRAMYPRYYNSPVRSAIHRMRGSQSSSP